MACLDFKKYLRHALICSLIGITFLSCQQENQTFDLNPPDSFPPLKVPERNPLTEEGVQLGEMLFNDPILSQDSTVSCSSCHIKEFAFTDRQALSKSGVSGKNLLRNTPTLINVAWSPTLFWDGGARDLESQTFGPLMHPDEMGDELLLVLKRMNNSEDYKKYFRNAFGVDSITSKYVSWALAQYERTLWSYNSDYDKYINGEIDFTEEQTLGLKLFDRHCVSCHMPPLFSDYKFYNIGLDEAIEPGQERVNLGRFRISHDSLDFGSFKTPTLRNVAVTYPYMHDGRFTDLNEIMDHYSSSVLLNVTEGNQELFTETEKESLVEFLKTLTDPAFKEGL